MVAPLIGEIVLIPFPFSDLSQSKRRPALVLASVEMNDFVLCQITSKSYGDRLAIPLKDSDFVSGGLEKDSFVRIGKLFTANSSIILGIAGRLSEEKFTRVVDDLIRLFCVNRSFSLGSESY